MNEGRRGRRVKRKVCKGRGWVRGGGGRGGGGGGWVRGGGRGEEEEEEEEEEEDADDKKNIRYRTQLNFMNRQTKKKRKQQLV